MSETAFGDRDSLARLLDGPAAELETRLGPPDEALDRLFAALGPGQLDPAGGQRPFLVQFEVRAANGVHTRPVWFGPDQPSPTQRPALSYSVDLLDFLLMASGRLDPNQAFMSGRLRMSGDMSVAGAVEAWLTAR